MDLTRNQTIDGMLAEYAAFADLVGSLSAEEWTAASRCDGWEVRHVAGHVIGLAEDIAAGRAGSRNAAEEAESVIGDEPRTAAARLRSALGPIAALAPIFTDDAAWNGPSGVPDLTLGEGILLVYFDLYVHADDIRAAVGRPSVVHGRALTAALVYVQDQLSTRSWGPARVVFRDRTEDFGALEIGGGGPTHLVEPLPFVLAATGRLDAASIGLDASVNLFAA